VGEGSEIITKSSPLSVEALTAKLVALAEARGLKVFDVIDQRAAAEEIGLSLRPTTLVLLGSPAAGTPLMDAAPMLALDLPLKVLIWAEDEGARVSYLSPSALETRYNLPKDLRGRLDGLHALTDALVEP
jgi:uncharacterized protein (DUF302 family)